jgi:hypothetical protein
MSAGIRDFVKQISPPWLATGVAEKLLYVMGLGADAALEKLNQGQRLHLPTYGDNSALPYIGADRLIPQGLNEAVSNYAVRLKFWLDDWQIAGNAKSLLQQTLGELSPNTPLVRTVSDTSVWDTWISGSNTFTSAPSHYNHSSVPNWNWDGEADPHPLSPTAWWRWWLLLFSDISPVGGGITAATNANPIAITTSAPHGLVTGAVVWITGVLGNIAANSPNGSSAWTITVTGASSFTLNLSAGTGPYVSGGTVYLITDPTIKPTTTNWILPSIVLGAAGVVMGDPRFAVGFSLPRGQPGAAGLIAGFKAIVSLWKGAHTWARWTIVSFDNARFDPAQPADGTHNPDGTWGPWLKIVTLNNISQYVPTRSTDARYCDPVL